MDLDLSRLDSKTIKVSRGLTYTYFTHAPTDGKPTLILFHGWPDTARLWAGLINSHLLPAGYGIIAIDCLGYGGSSKPTNPAAYAWHLMTRDAVEIIDAEENIVDGGRVISAGHDWGAAMAQRLYNYHPDRVAGIALFNVSYIPPMGSFDLAAFNQKMTEVYGYPLYAYWNFFMADDGPDLMTSHAESVYAVAFGDPETWKQNWTTEGGMRAFVSEGRTQPTLPFATPEHKRDFMDRLSGEGGFTAPNCWYRAYAQGTQNLADKLVADDAKKVNVPMLFWGAERDFVCKPDAMRDVLTTGLVPDCRFVARDGGHWAILELPDVVGHDVLEWLQEKF